MRVNTQITLCDNEVSVVTRSPSPKSQPGSKRKEKQRKYFSEYIPYSPSNQCNRKVNRGGKKAIPLSKEEIRANFVYTMKEAAERLGVSTSTLKRRYREMYGRRMWPYERTVEPIEMRTLETLSLTSILNEVDVPTKYVDSRTMITLLQAFTRCHDVNVRGTKPSPPGQPE